jgi:hypothetical protein
MSNTYYIYRRDDGVFTGQRITLAPFDAAKLAAFTPDGCAAYCGVVDRKTQRCQEITDDFGNTVQQLVPYTPPPKPWEVRSVLLVRTQLLERMDADLAELDKHVARPAGEIAEALASGSTPPAAAVSKLQAVNAQKAQIRAARAIAAAVPDDAGADGIAALDAITWP